MLAPLLALAALAEPPPADVFVQQVLERVDDVDAAWLHEHVRPRFLAVAPTDAWYVRFQAALSPTGALGAQLRPAPAVLAVSSDGLTTRVVLATTPLTAVTLYADGDVWRIDGIGPTSCVACAPPERFVRDALTELATPGLLHHQLLPGLDLTVAPYVKAHPSLLGEHWVGALHTRNQTAGYLRAALRDAAVMEASEDEVIVGWPSGHVERWPVHLGQTGWAVDYDGLPEDSVLRFSRSDLDAWRSDRLVPHTRLANWAPTWRVVDDGLHIASDAVDARFDPRNGTVLLGLALLDGQLAGIVRVDPIARTVEARWEVPPSTQNPTDVTDWFTRWPMVVAPSGTAAMLALPTRLWRVDLQSGATESPMRTTNLTALRWLRPSGEAERLVTAEANGTITSARDDVWTEHWVSGRPVAVDGPIGGLVVTTAAGVITRLHDDGTTDVIGQSCPHQAVGAALSPDGSELLVQCGPEDTLAAVRVPLSGGEVVAVGGRSGADAAVSWSPDGRYFTTHAPPTAGHAVNLWSARDNRVVAAFGGGRVHGVRWSGDGDRLLTLNLDGTAWLWELATLRQHHLVSP